MQRQELRALKIVELRRVERLAHVHAGPPPFFYKTRPRFRMWQLNHCHWQWQYRRNRKSNETLIRTIPAGFTFAHSSRPHFALAACATSWSMYMIAILIFSLALVMSRASDVSVWKADFFAAVGAPGKKAADFASADWTKAIAFMESREVPRGGVAALAEALGVARPTLSNRFRTGSVSTLGRGRPTTLPPSAEKLFAERLTTQNDAAHAWSVKLAHKKLKLLAEHVGIGADAVKDPRALTRLIKRQGISKLVAEKTTASRALAMNRTAIAHHFKVLAAAGWADAPAHLKFNFDETSLTDNNSKKEKVRVPRACRPEHAHCMSLLYCTLFPLF